MNIMTSMWRRLRAEGYTERQLSEESGIDRGSVHRLLHGRKPTVDMAARLLDSGLLTEDESTVLSESMEPPERECDNSRILCISDLHAPWMHRDTVDFLGALKKKYKPTRIIFSGDEVDQHALSYHEHDPDLPSAGDELEQAIAKLTPLYKMFPEADILHSNHGSLAFRKAKTAGIPRKYLRSYREVLQAPTGWRWHPELLIEVPNGNQVFFHHGLSSNVLKVVERRAVCVVQGHFHCSYNIQYVSNPNHLLWGMQIGCSIDPPALAFEYDKLQVGRPVIGHGLILNGLPQLLPMVIRRGRWTGVVP